MCCFFLLRLYFLSQVLRFKWFDFLLFFTERWRLDRNGKVLPASAALGEIPIENNSETLGGDPLGIPGNHFLTTVE